MRCVATVLPSTAKVAILGSSSADAFKRRMVIRSGGWCLLGAGGLMFGRLVFTMNQAVRGREIGVHDEPGCLWQGDWCSR